MPIEKTRQRLVCGRKIGETEVRDYRRGGTKSSVEDSRTGDAEEEKRAGEEVTHCGRRGGREKLITDSLER